MATLFGQNPPSESTVGQIGDVYTNTLTGDEYKCVSITRVKTADGETPYYFWTLLRKNAEDASF